MPAFLVRRSLLRARLGTGSGDGINPVRQAVTTALAHPALPKRMLAFLFQFADLCEVYAARSGRPFADQLDEAWPGMAQAWG